MSDEVRPAIFDPEHYADDAAAQRKAESELSPAHGSAPITAAVAKEMFDLFVRHGLNHEQCINVMVATTKMIGRKAANDEVGAFCLFLHKAMKICPELGDVAKMPNDRTEPHERTL